MEELKFDKGRVYLTKDSKGNLNGLSSTERLNHLHILGNTGTGKSTIIWNMILQDILNGLSGFTIDIFGHSQDGVLPFIPPHRIDNVAYLSGSDFEKVFSISAKNISEKNLKDTKEKISLMYEYLKIFEEDKFTIFDLSSVSDDPEQRKFFANILLDVYLTFRKNFINKKENIFLISSTNVYIDEAQLFNSSLINSTIELSKKLGISLVISHQFLNQLDPILQINIFSSFEHFLYLTMLEEDAVNISQTIFGINDIGILKNPGKFFANFRRNFKHSDKELLPEQLLDFDYKRYNLSNLLIKKY